MTPAPEIDRTNNGIFSDAWIDDKQAHLDRCRRFSFGSACHGRRWIDDDTEQLRAEGNHGSARSRDQGKGHDRVRAHRSRRGRQAGLSLRPTEVLLFGNAKAGTPLMQSNQTIGIDLPLKALVWQDADGKVWLSYNEPSWLAKRHGLAAGTQATVDAMAAGLGALARGATAKE